MKYIAKYFPSWKRGTCACTSFLIIWKCLTIQTSSSWISLRREAEIPFYVANYCYLFHASLQHIPSASDWEQQHQPFGHQIMLWLQVHCGDKTAFLAAAETWAKAKKKKKSMSFLLNPSILRSVYVAVSYWLADFNTCQEKWIQFMEILSYEQLFQLMMHLLSQWKFECWVWFSLTF